MKLYFNAKRNVLWGIKDRKILNLGFVGISSEQALQDYTKKAYGVSKVNYINSLTEITNLFD